MSSPKTLEISAKEDWSRPFAGMQIEERSSDRLPKNYERPVRVMFTMSIPRALRSNRLGHGLRFLGLFLGPKKMLNAKCLK
jgi:hypothetical protein